ncbi:kinase-like protein [Rhizophagus irregularis]|uniref:Kinase-like protein n=1 Tax=Rhizophagus irregularis TaxID=588596 RepID=A0A2N0RDP3_9GLOM|nr:kinase-like protein [Rhizophagus irregularis]
MSGLSFYGLTKCPETKEFMMIIEFANEGNLRSILSNKFNNIMWESKIYYLYLMLIDLKDLHELGYCHKDFQSNILQADTTYISDFELSGPANEQKLDGKVYGVMPYIAPEVLNGEPYTLSSDTIYSVGVVMAELSSGKPPFYNKKHDLSLALAICSSYGEVEKFSYKRKEIKAAFEEADKEIQHIISTSYKKNSDAVFTISNSIQLGDIDDESKVDDLVN